MKKIIPVIIAVVVVGGGAFFGGMKYTESKAPSGRGAGAFANLTPEQRAARFGQGGGAGLAGGPVGGGATAGEVLSKDDTSMTVKLRDGGSKIILLSGSTQIMKATVGSLDDVVVGEQITVMGTNNDDGSVTAQNIQIRPALPANAQATPPGTGAAQ